MSKRLFFQVAMLLLAIVWWTAGFALHDESMQTSGQVWLAASCLLGALSQEC